MATFSATPEDRVSQFGASLEKATGEPNPGVDAWREGSRGGSGRAELAAGDLPTGELTAGPPRPERGRAGRAEGGRAMAWDDEFVTGAVMDSILEDLDDVLPEGGSPLLRSRLLPATPRACQQPVLGYWPVPGSGAPTSALQPPPAGALPLGWSAGPSGAGAGVSAAAAATAAAVPAEFGGGDGSGGERRPELLGPGFSWGRKARRSGRGVNRRGGVATPPLGDVEDQRPDEELLPAQASPPELEPPPLPLEGAVSGPASQPDGAAVLAPEPSQGTELSSAQDPVPQPSSVSEGGVSGSGAKPSSGLPDVEATGAPPVAPDPPVRRGRGRPKLSVRPPAAGVAPLDQLPARGKTRAEASAPSSPRGMALRGGKGTGTLSPVGKKTVAPAGAHTAAGRGAGRGAALGGGAVSAQQRSRPPAEEKGNKGEAQKSSECRPFSDPVDWRAPRALDRLAKSLGTSVGPLLSSVSS